MRFKFRFNTEQETQPSPAPPSSTTTSITTTTTQQETQPSPPPPSSTTITMTTSSQQTQTSPPPSHPPTSSIYSPPSGNPPFITSTSVVTSQAQAEIEIVPHSPPTPATNIQQHQHSSSSFEIQTGVSRAIESVVPYSHHNITMKIKPYFIVILLQLLFALMNFSSKLSMNNGLNSYILVPYRNFSAFLVIAPFAIYYERNQWPRMTFRACGMIFALSILGPILDQDLYFLGMHNSTATLASALCNTLPAMTFILACLTRRENVDIKSKPSQAKILGTAIIVIGAMVTTLVKGPVLFGSVGSQIGNHHDGGRIILGLVFILISTLSSALSNILQTITLDHLPLPLTVTALIALLGSIEGLLVAFFMNQGYHYSVWSLFKWDVKLLSAIYAGIFCSGLGFYLRGQVMQDRGPVFATMFNPVCMVLVAILGYLFLDEQQLLGRMIGALIIILGLYCVIWGTHKDNIRRQQEANARGNPVVV